MTTQRPTSPHTRLVLLYDDGCGLCKRAVRLLRAMDVWQHLAYLPLHSPAAEELPNCPPLDDRFYELKAYRTHDHEWFGEIQAVAQALKLCPQPFCLAGHILGWRWLAPLTTRVYRRIAESRHCLLPPLDE